MVPFPEAVRVAVCPQLVVTPVTVGKLIGATLTVTGTRGEVHAGT